MTVEEFSREFDLLYGNASKTAPNLDEYEKSVYLTKAQLELVKNTFNPLGNKYGRGFEQSSKRRHDLSNLITTYNTSKFINEGDLNKISSKSFKYSIPSDVFIIIYERLFSNDGRLCLDDSNYIEIDDEYTPGSELILSGNYREINIRPITHDEYNILKRNPFKKPNENEAWRIDSVMNYSSSRSVEIISEYKPSMYSIRYIKYPDPIILVNLDEEFPGEDLTIDGKNIKQTSKLNKGIHPEILNRAVELADHDYKGGNFQTRVQMNQRDE